MPSDPKTRIETLVKEATEKLQKAVELSDRYQINFRFDGPVDCWEEPLGFGGEYEAGEIWEASGSCEWEESGESTPGTWNPDSKED